MKILQVINNLGSGGAEKLISDFAPVVKNKGYHIEILLLRRSGSLYIDQLVKRGIRITFLSEDSLYSISHILKIRSFILKGKFDIVHVHVFPSLYFASLAKLFGANAKFIFTEHNTFNKRRGNFFYRQVERIIYSQYDSLVGITTEVCRNLKEHLNLKYFRYKVINNGIDLSAFHKSLILERKDLLPLNCCSKKWVCMVGRFSHAKDQATLIEAISNLSKDVHLLLLGEGPNQSSLEALAHKLNVIDRVHFLGYRNDIPDVLRLCDIGVLSSHWEGMPLSAIEVMAAGIPFIGSKVPGIVDLVKSDFVDAGLLFMHSNPVDLKQKIEILLADIDLYNDVALACHKRSFDFSIEKMVDQYLEEYEYVLREN